MSEPMTKSDAGKLFDEFLEHPKLVWGANNTGCEAKADLMAEVASENGYEVSKIWVRPQTSADSFLVYLNEAGTEQTAWNYHVAIMVKVKNGSSSETMVMDPSLFDEPVSLDTWSSRLTRLSDQYDVPLEFKESRREAFFGPEDMISNSNRQNALARREEILNNSSNMDDPMVFEGFMMKHRGEFVDELMESNPQKFEQLKTLLLNEDFKKWFRTPVPNGELKTRLGKNRFYGIKSNKIKQKVNVGDIDASVQLKEHYWEQIGLAFKKLSNRSKELLGGGFNADTMAFKADWEDGTFRQKWFSSDGGGTWSEYNVNVDID